MKKLLVILLALVVVIFSALIFLPKLINWNGYKPRIASMVKDSTGRDLHIDGDIELSIFPHLVFSISGVHLSNAQGMKAPEMLSIGAVSVRLSLLPLLMRRIAVESIVVHEPSVNLELDKDGRANWEFARAGETSTEKGDKSSEGETTLPIKGLSLKDVRLSQGSLSMINAITGQTILAKDIDLKASMANLSSPLTLALRMNLNKEPVTVDLSLDSPIRILKGPAAGLEASVSSKHISIEYRGKLQQRPIPGLDGTFSLDIPSVGHLASWLGRPLDRTQPDPGSLKARASFQANGKTVALKEATIEGKTVKVKATGRFDGSGDITHITLNVESDAIDVDMYLPPPTTEKAANIRRGKPGKAKPRRYVNIMEVFSVKPIDLSFFRKTEADVHISVQGIKAMGYEVGKVDFTAGLKNGLLTAAVNELSLYGGNVKGILKLDGTGKALDANATLMIDRLKVDNLARAVTGSELLVTGIASGKLQAMATGENPRRLVESLKGGVTFDLGGVDVKNAPTGSISKLNLTLALPGINQEPSFKARMIYNKQPVTVGVFTDPLRDVLSNDVFALKASVDSPLLRLGYDGKVQRQPVTGLHGAFNLDIPSVSKLALWVGHPLEKSQPDPGPLKVRAIFQGEGAKIVLKTATLEGKDLKASASGSYEGSGDIAKLTLMVDTGRIDIDRYLPALSERKDNPPKDLKPVPRVGNLFAALSDRPFDLGALKKMAADVQIDMDGVQAGGYRIGPTSLSMILKNGILTTDLRELNLYSGKVKGTFKLDGQDEKIGLDTILMITGVKIDELVKTATEKKVAASGTASGKLNLNAHGDSPKTLVESLTGKAIFNLGNVEIKEAKALSDINFELDLPGLGKPFELKGGIVYNKEPVQYSFKLDSIQRAITDNPFTVGTAVKSKVLSLACDGKLQHKPTPGFDGALNLDIPSVGGFMQWLDQPLPKEQPDPGSLKLRAVFGANDSHVMLKEASLSGKALQVKASGSWDKSGSIPILKAKVQVENADLSAYMPPSAPSKTSPAKKKPETRTRPAEWSDEPLNLSAFSTVNGDIEIKIDSLQYRDLTIKPGHMTVTLKSGLLDAKFDPFKISNGKIASSVHLDASSTPAGLDYQVTISDLDARPFLKTLANNDRLSGKTELQLKATAKGRSQKEMVNSLNGNGQFKFLNGAIYGINLAAVLRKAKTLGLDKQAGEVQKTDFTELSGSFTIKNGVIDNKDLKMLAPLVRLTGEGLVPLPKRAMDYDITAKLVPTLEGQGGKDAMAGVPIPIKIKGPWDNIAYKVDWQEVFRDISRDPERWKDLPQNLREASKGFGVDLPLPKFSDIGKSAIPMEQLEQLKKQILTGPTAPIPATKDPTEVPKTGAQQTEKKQAAPSGGALKIFQDLLKR